jgi:hypothetical protein
VGTSPIRQPLQPEAIGAVMEVTKWLKPSISVSSGDHQITLIHINYVGCRILALPFRSFRDADTLYHLKGQRSTKDPASKHECFTTTVRSRRSAMSTMNTGCDFGSRSVGGIGDATSFVAYPSVEHAPFGLGATGGGYHVTGCPERPGGYRVRKQS